MSVYQSSDSCSCGLSLPMLEGPTQTRPQFINRLILVPVAYPYQC
jgi:hypothetical protein